MRTPPKSLQSTAARIYGVNPNTVRTNLHRAKATTSKATHGGHNKVLSEAQIKSIYQYVKDSYHAGYGASKRMVFMAICHLKSAEIPPKPHPSWRWFQTFMKEHSTMFSVIKMKAIARVRVATHDITTVESVETWFAEYKAWCTQHKIEPQQIYNFDETGFRVGVAPGEEVIVPKYLTEVCDYSRRL